MNTPKRHHYLPESYQRGFCKNGYVWVYDRVDNSYRHEQPVNTGVKKHYYSITDASGKRNAAIETDLMQWIDSNGISAIRRLSENQTLEEADKGRIAYFASFMRFRGPAFEATVNGIYEKMIKKFSRKAFATDERVQALIDEYKEKTSSDMDFDVRALRDFVDGNNYRIETDRIMSLEAMLKCASQGADVFYKLNWVFLKAPVKKSFITSDNPFLLLGSRGDAQDELYTGIGLATTGVTKIIPLSERICLLMYDEGECINYVDATVPQMREINIKIAAHCYRYVLARDRPLLESLVKRIQLARSKWESNVTIS